jgi:superoxide dismutase, Fe-Mn family
MYTEKQFACTEGLEGLSAKMMQEHYKLYQGYIKKANEIEEKLKTVDKSTANATYSDLRALKLGYSFATDAIKSHELFFGHLGGGKNSPSGLFVEELLVRNFGSYENWIEDMKATGMAARGWVWTALDWQTNTVFNWLGDAHDAFPIWNATPFIALDVYEHAYFMDYGVSRADYIKTFFKTINWEVPNQLLLKTGADKIQTDT